MNSLAFAHSLFLGGGAGVAPVERPSRLGAASGGLRERAVTADPILLARPHGAGLRALLRSAADLDKKARR